MDCANGAFFEPAPAAFETLGAQVTTIGVEPDGTNINDGCGAMDLAAVSRKVVEVGADLGVAFDGDGDRVLAVDELGETLDGDQILAILAPALDIDLVAVTVMTNLGFHRLMDEHGIRRDHSRSATATCSRRCAPRRCPRRGTVGSHPLAARPRDGRRPRGGAASCGALGGRTLSEAAGR